MYLTNKRYNKFRNTSVGALIAASVVMVSSPSAIAAIIGSGVVNISIPNTTAGIYLNFITNATGASGAAVTGWDFNPYGTGTSLDIYWNPVLAASVRGAGVASVAQPTQFAVLPSGTSVGPTSTFSSSLAAPSPNFTAGVTNAYLGVRFVNEGTSAINYGWVQLTTTAGTGFPATIVRYAYENTGQSILAGTTPVTLQSFNVD